eukprot:CAMPEP_0176352430 /NCGR_PEP_ID=MMETSP0126-20121128/11022_1 /TAXON_ID=141414 ORGANISM="Strombidinopsis acuminatum, Strain SPMC142" /NCGR_SAMPLE_ID=MMETSP0126 /ASSEMBLY_ACC=CAM_ASM_000229 /LENGTH=68 /DNA_ID=CAMNT_0017703543 /DNA_START=1388 /DNA_END=1594 /DNA_ORIENTATION=+
MKPELDENEIVHSIEQLMQHFDPKNDKIDKFILYEITGRKNPDDHFNGEDEYEDDDNQSEYSYDMEQS